MEREVGGGIGMGNTCKPMAVSFQCMTKSTTIKKLKKKKKQEVWCITQALLVTRPPELPHIKENVLLMIEDGSLSKYIHFSAL